MASEQLDKELKTAKPKRKKWPIVIIVIVVLILAAGGILAYLFSSGTIVPANASAKYDLFSYIYEDDVADYINTYKTQSGYADDSDETWVEFYQAENTTPELLRTKTIRQLIIDAEEEKKYSELNITADEAVLAQYIQTMKENLAMGDDEIWAQTLEMYGRTEEQVTETYAKVLKRKALFEKEVPVPTPTDDQIYEYLTTNCPDGVNIKHIYYLYINNDEDLSEYENLKNAQAIRRNLTAGEVTAETFATYVAAYCTDSDLVNRGGADGWSIDVSDRSTNYQGAVKDTKVGQVSNLFKEDDGYAVIWIDTHYKLPAAENVDKDKYFDGMPESLKSYFSDLEAQELWSDDCDSYEEKLFEDANPMIFTTSTEASYYVEMPDTSQTEESTEESSEE